MTYNPLDPINNVFTEIKEELNNLATFAGAPITQVQCINMAHLILLKTGKFSHAMREWRNVAAPTWINFKDHFRDA